MIYCACAYVIIVKRLCTAVDIVVCINSGCSAGIDIVIVVCQCTRLYVIISICNTSTHSIVIVISHRTTVGILINISHGTTLNVVIVVIVRNSPAVNIIVGVCTSRINSAIASTVAVADTVIVRCYYTSAIASTVRINECLAIIRALVNYTRGTGCSTT